jgi:hypothetical protein
MRKGGMIGLALLVAGCHRYVAIDPVDLPQVAAPSPPYASVPPEYELRRVRNTDGEVVEVQGQFDVVVRTMEADFEFTRPVTAWFSGSMLVVQGAWEPATEFELSEIREVDLKQSSPGRTIAVVVPVSVVGLGLLLLWSGGGN